MRTLVRAPLLALCLGAIAVLAYAFAWNAWAILDLVPDEWWSTIITIGWLSLCVGYAKWWLGLWRKPRKARRSGSTTVAPKVDPLEQAIAKGITIMEAELYTSPHQLSPMQELEIATHVWGLDGSLPGSVGAAELGLEEVDRFLEGR